MKRLFTLFIVLLSIQGIGQNFHFDPTNVLNKTINSSGNSDLNIDIIRDNTVDTLYLEYELITNTLPEEWYQGYCDNHGCWGSLPESGYMSPCYDDLNSFIKLSIDPAGYEGSGTVEYFVYEIGHYEDGLLMTFNIETPGLVGIEEVLENQISVYPNPASDFIQVHSEVELDHLSIFSLTGQLVQVFNNPKANRNLNISDLESGIYLMKTKDISGLVFTQKIKKY